MFAAESTAKWATERGFGLTYQRETGSTNTDAKLRATRDLTKAHLFLAAHQTAGRGRGDHQWLDTGVGECLLSTWSFKLNSSPQAITGPRIGLALYRAAAQGWPSLDWSVKAPNDLFLNALKVGGLLLESVSAGREHRLLIGLGLNVENHPRRFGAATHLNEALKRAVEPTEWFHFLDCLSDELQTALIDITRPELDASVRRELQAALNANSNRAHTIEDITGAGDLLTTAGLIRWMEL